jgi:hypothetical protein
LHNPVAICRDLGNKALEISINKIVLDHDSNGFQSRVHLEFLENISNVISNRTRADRKESRDISGSMAYCQEKENFPFAWCQRISGSIPYSIDHRLRPPTIMNHPHPAVKKKYGLS